MFEQLSRKGTQLMAIYQPYFYIIQDTRNGMYYAGAKWAEGCHPDQLLKEDGYPTSSEIIKKIIDENGLDTFVIRKIRTFETGDEAYDYETRFLVKVDARKNPRFYNGHNNDGHAPSYGTDEFKQMMFHKHGVQHPSHSEKLLSKKVQNNLEKYGVEYPFCLSEFKEESRRMHMKKYGVDHYSKTDEYLEKIKKTKKERYGDENYNNREQSKSTSMEKYGVYNPAKSKEVKEKTKTILLERYGDENYNNREQSKSTSMEKYGVDNPAKSKEVKEKTKNTYLEKYGAESGLKVPEILEKISNTNIERYGVDNPFKSSEIQGKIQKTIQERVNRSKVIELKVYQKKYKIKFGPGWTRKSDDFIDKIYEETVEKYGDITSTS
jgi:hypothetical protein